MRRNGNTGAAADVKHVLIDLERFRELSQHRLNQGGDLAGIAAAGDDDHEFIAAKPVNSAGITDRTVEPLRDFDQQLVAGRMAVGVVHVLEAVQIEQRDGMRLVTLAGGEQVVSSFFSETRFGNPVSWS